MSTIIREYRKSDILQMLDIWNTVVYEGEAFPQTEELKEEEALEFFAKQDFTGVVDVDEEVVGLYILHANNIGRCGHIANASYAVKRSFRGMRIGEILVESSLKKAKELGYQMMQLNAVVQSNTRAIRLYERNGFVKVGTIPKGFLLKNNTYEDIIVYYHNLDLKSHDDHTDCEV